MIDGKNKYLRIALMILALALPALSLVALGSLWLWQSGYLIAWAIGACALAVVVYLFELWMLRPARFGRQGHDVKRSGPRNDGEPLPDIGGDDASVRDDDGADPNWTERERGAWSAVKALGAGIETNSIDSRKAMLDLGRDVVLVVAEALHPQQRDPALHFTLPEALALIEQVSRRLRPIIAGSVPLGDTITVGQAMRLYNWRSVIGLASKGYDLWRIIRVVNPVTAASQEMREQVTKRFYDWGRDAAARKLLQLYVEEVGRAAIDLYAGRLKLNEDELAGHVTRESIGDLRREHDQMREPLRFLIGGQIGVGKSSLINALCDEVRAVVDVLPSTQTVAPHVLQKDGMREVLLLDMPGLDAGQWDSDKLTEEALFCDLVLWVVSASRVDRELDRDALKALGACFAREPRRAAPPIILVMSHIDRLRPFTDWKPPYDLNDDSRPKSVSIVEARQVICSELEQAADNVVPAYLGEEHEAYNMDAIWARIVDVLPEAKAARVNRIITDAAPGFSWRRLASQAVQGARGVKRTIMK